MKKYLVKYISVLLTFVMFSTNYVVASAITAKEVAEQTSPKSKAEDTIGEELSDQDEYVDSSRMIVANSLLDALHDEEIFLDEIVSRGEFIDAVVKLMKLSNSGNAELIYQDVSAEHIYADSIYTAVGFGWISRTDNFRPDDEIKMKEAVKILVSAAGYAEKAEFFGGFPAGYYEEADNLKLFKGIEKRTETINPSQAKVFLYNFLNAEWSDKTYLHTIYGVRFPEASTGRTILDVFRNIFKVEGIINETTYNSLEYGESVSDLKYIEIYGEKFTYNDVSPDILGKYAIAFYDADTNDIVALDTESENEVVICDLNDLEFKSERLIEYFNGEKDKDIKITGGILVYNGRRTENFGKEYFDKDGYAVFVNNDDDKEYEVVHITSYEYMTVTSVDRFNGIITDEISGKTLNLKDTNEELVKIYDSNGKESNFYGISNDMILEIILPEDNSIATIRVVSNEVAGKATAYNDEYITINDMKYSYTRQFEKNYLNQIVFDKMNTYYLGYNNKIVSMKTMPSEYKYGFILRVFNDDSDSIAKVKLYTQEGKIAVVDLHDKLFVDGDKMNPLTFSSNYNNAETEYHKRIVRYMINKSGKISKIDMPTAYEPLTAGAMENEDDKLTYYPDYTKSLRYRSGQNTFTGRVMLGKATCFSIPNDITSDERRFKAGASKAVFTHDTNYTPYVFDIDEEGYAGFVMVIGDSFTGYENDYIIEKIYTGLNGDDEVVKVLSCWAGNKYYTFYLSEDIEIKKDTGSELVVGDIVRLAVDSENNITKVRVDFDYDKFAISGTVSSSNVMAMHVNPNYWYGRVYSVADTFVQISATKDEYGEYDFSQYALRPVSVNTTNVVKFDCERKILRPITKDEIKSYKASGEDGEYIFIRTDCDIPLFVVVYDNHNLR